MDSRREIEAEVLPLLEDGQKIAAIKLYREKTGAGLAEAKNAVEALAEKHGIELPQSSGGLFLVLLVIGGLVAAGVWWFYSQ